jgi:hypothetical protein
MQGAFAFCAPGTQNFFCGKGGDTCTMCNGATRCLDGGCG